MLINLQFRRLKQLQLEYNEEAKFLNMLEHKYEQKCAYICEKEIFNKYCKI